jgi:hypothetical protein
MAYQKFIESDLLFSFNQDWVIKKYDDHVYFKILAGQGLKGVDFIGIYKKKFLYLIEVKNYRQREYSPVAANWVDLEGASPPLAHIFIKKLDDSLKLIRVVERAQKRRWWSRLLYYIQDLTGDKRLNKDWKFWRKVYDLSLQAATVYPILWLELDPIFLTQADTTEAQYIERFQRLVEDQTHYEPGSFIVTSINTQSQSFEGTEVDFVQSDT